MPHILACGITLILILSFLGAYGVYKAVNKSDAYIAFCIILGSGFVGIMAGSGHHLFFFLEKDTKYLVHWCNDKRDDKKERCFLESPDGEGKLYLLTPTDKSKINVGRSVTKKDKGIYLDEDKKKNDIVSLNDKKK